MSDDKFNEIWGEVIAEIPKIRKILREAFHKDQEYTVHGKIIQHMERDAIGARLDMLRKKIIQ